MSANTDSRHSDLPGWPVDHHTLDLPAGMTLREDEHLVYLVWQGHVAGTFSSSVPARVLQVAADYISGRKGVWPL